MDTLFPVRSVILLLRRGQITHCLLSSNSMDICVGHRLLMEFFLYDLHVSGLLLIILMVGFYMGRIRQLWTCLKGEDFALMASRAFTFHFCAFIE